MSDLIDRTSCTATRHGTARAYNVHGCRCPDAKAARRRPQVPGTGTQPIGPIQHPARRPGGQSSTRPADPGDLAAALERIRRGQPAPPIDPATRRAVVDNLTRDNWSAAAIARALGIAQRSVVRHRAGLRTTSARQAA